jgi:hypothetical protein
LLFNNKNEYKACIILIIGRFVTDKLVTSMPPTTIVYRGFGAYQASLRVHSSHVFNMTAMGYSALF